MIKQSEDFSKAAIKNRFLRLSEEIMNRHRIGRSKDFAESIGLTSQQWNNVKNSDKHFVTTEILAYTQIVYPEMNLSWVLTGQGPMFSEESEVLKKVLEENQRLREMYMDKVLGKDEPAPKTAVVAFKKCLPLTAFLGASGTTSGTGLLHQV